MSGLPGTPRQSKRLLVALGVLLLVVVAFFLGRSTSSDPSSVEPESETAQVPIPGPTSELNGVPVGFARTEDGAVAAAAEFARVMSSTHGDASAYFKEFETIAAPAWRDSARAFAKQGLSFVTEQYGADAQLTFIPVRYRLDTYSPSSATVAIWGVTLASGSESALEESWVTGTVELQWTSGDWRVMGGESRPGPTPELVQLQEGGPATGLSEFKEFTRAPSP